MSLLNYFPKVPAVLRTFGPSVNTGGVWARGTGTDTDIYILHPQPAYGGELVWLPENDRKEAHFFAWTDSDIEIHDCVERQDADQIIYNGRVYLVVKSEDWEAGAFREIVMRLLPGVSP
jgi:hypothetical protein